MSNSKNKLKNLFQEYKIKPLLKAGFIMFIQTFLFTIITFITSLALALYGKVWHIDGSFNGRYFYLTSKINSAFKTIMFLPIIFQFGLLILSANFFGKKRYFEMKNLVLNTIYISLIINSVFYFLMFILAPILLKVSGVKNESVWGWNNIDSYNVFKNNLKLAKDNNINADEIFQTILNGGNYNGLIFNATNPIKLIDNELNEGVKFLRIALIEVFLYSIAQIFCASLLSMKKNLFSVISYSLGLIIRLVWTYILYSTTNKNPINIIYFSFEGLNGSTFQLIISFIFLKNTLFKGEKITFKHLRWNSKLISKTLYVGLPIALESGIWYVSQFMLARAIPFFGFDDKYIGIYRAINSLYDVFASFSYGLSFLASSYVSIEFSKHNYDEIKKTEKSLFLIALFGEIILGAISLILTNKLLQIYNIDKETIKKIGYILIFIYSIKLIFDLGNIITLRSLWSLNIVWKPVLISVFSMICVQLFSTYFMLEILKNKNISQDTIFVIFVLSTLLDPTLRTIIYKIKWKKLFRKPYSKLVLSKNNI